MLIFMLVLQKSFAAKGMLFNYNIPFLDTVFDKVLFVHVRRDPVANIASVLDARRRQLGSEEAWYSFKIAEYEELKALDPISQVAGQVHHIKRAVSSGMGGVAEQRKLVVQYEDFCAAPERVFESLCEKIGLKGAAYQGQDSFKVTQRRNCRIGYR